MKTATYCMRTVFCVILIFSSNKLFSDLETPLTINIDQVNRQIIDQNKVNYLTNKGGYFKKLATRNSALAHEAIKRGVNRYSNGTPQDLNNDQSYNEQLIERSGLAVIEGNPNFVSTLNIIGTEGTNTDKANLLAAETLYLRKDEELNLAEIEKNTADDNVTAATPEWTTAGLYNTAMIERVALANTLGSLNYYRGEIQEYLNSVYGTGVYSQEDFTADNIAACQLMAGLAKLAGHALAAQNAVSTYNSAVIAEETARLANVAATNLAAKNSADSDVTSASVTLSSAQQAYIDATGDSDLSDYESLTEGQNGYAEAQSYISAKTDYDNKVEIQTTATGNYNTAANNYASDLGQENLTEDDITYINNTSTVAINYLSAQNTTSNKNTNMENTIAAYNTQRSITDGISETAISEDGSNVSAVYTEVKNNYDTESGTTSTEETLSDLVTLNEVYANTVTNLPSAVSNRNLALGNYNDSVESYETAAAAYNASRTENLASIPEDNRVSYEVMDEEITSEDEVPDTTTADIDAESVNSLYTDINNNYNGLLNIQDTKEALLAHAQEEFDEAEILVNTYNN